MIRVWINPDSRLQAEMTADRAKAWRWRGSRKDDGEGQYMMRTYKDWIGIYTERWMEGGR